MAGDTIPCWWPALPPSRIKPSGPVQVAPSISEVCEAPNSSAFTHFFHPLLLFAELGAGPSWAERIHLQSPSPPASCGDLRFLCSGLFLPLFHFRKTDFSSSKRNIWLMANLKCLRFCDNCLFLKKHLYSHLQNVADFRQFEKNFGWVKAKGHYQQVSYLCPFIRSLCFSIAPAGMLKHHKAAGVLYIFLPDEISKISAGFLPKRRSGEVRKWFYLFSSHRCVSGRQKHCSCFGWCFWFGGNIVSQCFSASYLGTLLKCRFWFCKSEWGLSSASLTSSQVRRMLQVQVVRS